MSGAAGCSGCRQAACAAPVSCCVHIVRRPGVLRLLPDVVHMFSSGLGRAGTRWRLCLLAPWLRGKHGVCGLCRLTPRHHHGAVLCARCVLAAWKGTRWAACSPLCACGSGSMRVCTSPAWRQRSVWGQRVAACRAVFRCVPSSCAPCCERCSSLLASCSALGLACVNRIAQASAS